MILVELRILHLEGLVMLHGNYFSCGTRVQLAILVDELFLFEFYLQFLKGV